MLQCSIEGCTGKHQGKGYCVKHYAQYRRGTLNKARHVLCTVHNCGRKHWSKGFCQKHYKQHAQGTIEKHLSKPYGPALPPKFRQNKQLAALRHKAKECTNGFVPPTRYPIVYDQVGYILLNTGDIALFDPDDYGLVRGRKWHKTSHGYVANGRGGKAVYLHALLNPLWGMVDHRNGNKLDCRRTNLRECTYLQNAHNSGKRSGTSSIFKGVYCVKRAKGPDKWVAQITLNHKTCYLGTFETEELAARAYDNAAIKHFGEFARVNFPIKILW